ncbi:FAD-dependent oxidoreductase [Streptomyces sp. NPDC002676]
MTRDLTVLTGADGEVAGVRTSTGTLPAPHVVNAAGAWGGELARRAGVDLPVLPRRGGPRYVMPAEDLPAVLHGTGCRDSPGASTPVNRGHEIAGQGLLVREGQPSS